MEAREIIDRVEDAADATEAVATRLQQQTSAVDLDNAAQKAKDLVHDVREALEDMKEDNEETVDAEQAAKVAEAAAAVENELNEIAAELTQATDEATGSGQNGLLNSKKFNSRKFKSTEDAVKELEVMASKRAGRSIQGRTIALALIACWLTCIVMIILWFGLAGTELAFGGGFGVLWGLFISFAYYLNRRWKAERNQRVSYRSFSSTRLDGSRSSFFSYDK